MTQNIKLEATLERLEEGVRAIATSEDFQRWLKVLSLFHDYSWGNTLLIWVQKPEATRVAGFRTWKKMGRYVRKGEKGIRILAPNMVKAVDESAKEEYELKGFRTVSVFDISQTEGDPVPELPGEHMLLGSSDSGRALFKALERVLIREDITLFERDLGDAYGAYSHTTKSLTLNENLELDMKVNVMLHELTHHYAHSDLAPGQYQEERSEIEAVTESVAYVVCNHFGIDPGDHSFSYIAAWAKDPELIKTRMSEIQKLSKAVIQRIEESAPAKVEVCLSGENTSPSPVAA